MKKRLLALVLTALLLTALLPTAAMAEEAYNLWVGGVQVTSANAGDIFGDGTAKYEGDAAGGNLTLTNAVITGTYNHLSIVGTNLNLTVTLSGENTLSGGQRAIDLSGGDLKIQGDGKLTAGGSSMGIRVRDGKLEIQGCTVHASSAVNYAISAKGEIAITSSEVKASADSSYPINSDGGGITIKDSTVEATAVGYYGIYAAGSITVKGSSRVTSTARAAALNAPSFTFEDGLGVVVPAGGYANGRCIVDAGGNQAASVEIDKLPSFTITFVNEDGTVLQTGQVVMGQTPSYTGATPTKDPDAEYSYTFAGWTPEITAVTGDATYTATYTSTVNKYAVKFVNDDGTELQNSEWEYGATPKYKGETPTKESDEQYDYSFKGWTPEITSVVGEASYTAEYDKTLRKYTVKFISNGEEFSSIQVEYGKTVSEPDDDPVRTGYVFDGWYADEAGKQAYDFSTAITGETQIYAKWTKIKYSVVSGGNAVFTKNSGKELEITVKRSPDDKVCFTHFQSVQIDGKDLTKDTDYTAKAGSTVITLKPAALGKLTSGNHTVTITFDDGKATTGLLVKAGSGGGGGGGKNPQTGDNSNPALWIGLMSLSGLGLCGAALYWKRRRVNADADQ